jgi:UDP-GlcNAc:undecaprenyl-phosphate GlcNAc-1-phosphate transferase
MKTFTVIFLLSLLLAVLLTPLVRRIALGVGAVDRPGRRKIHRGTVPRLGGLAIFAAALLPLLSVLFLYSNRLTLLVSEASAQVLGLLIGSGTILIVGICDDIWGWNAWVKLPLEVLAAVVVYVAGFQVFSIGNPFGSPIELGVAGPVITILWIVGLANAVNLLDGIDGLAAGTTAFASIALFVCALVLGHHLVALMVIALGGALVGFLRHNFYPAKIFMGDSGSLFVGFTLACLSIEGSLKSSAVVALAIPMLIFGLPITDTALAAGRRFFHGKPIFLGDSEHVHHRLLRSGFSQRQSSVILYGVTAFLGLAAILLTTIQSRAIGIGFLVTGILAYVLIRQVVRVRATHGGMGQDGEALRRARRILFEAGEALRSVRTEEETWEVIRSAAERLGYEAARWELDLPGGGRSEMEWNGTTADEWDHVLPLAFPDGGGRLRLNRPAEAGTDFAMSDTVLAILCDVAVERMTSRPSPAPGRGVPPPPVPQGRSGGTPPRPARGAG